MNSTECVSKRSSLLACHCQLTSCVWEWLCSCPKSLDNCIAGNQALKRLCSSMVWRHCFWRSSKEPAHTMRCCFCRCVVLADSCCCRLTCACNKWVYTTPNHAIHKAINTTKTEYNRSLLRRLCAIECTNQGKKFTSLDVGWDQTKMTWPLGYLSSIG